MSNKLRILSIALSLFFFVSNSNAQEYEWAKAVNPTHFGQITAQTVSSDGDVYIASYERSIYGSTNFGLNTAYRFGELVMTKLDSSGTQIWTKTISDSKARIFSIKLLNNKVVVSGGYLDTLSFTTTDTFYGDAYFGSSFIAMFDTAGNYEWSKARPTANYEHYVSVGMEVRDTFLYEIGKFYGNFPSIRILNTSGDSLSALNLPTMTRYISDIEIDKNGSIYIAGSSFPTGSIDTIAMPKPPHSTGYLNYVAKLTADLSALWVRSSNYITLDLTPEVEIFADQVAYLSNEYPVGGSQNFGHVIKYYDTSGNFLRQDSITNDYSLDHHGRLGIASYDSFLLLSKPSGDTILQLTRIDKNYNDTLLAEIACGTSVNYPQLGQSNDAIYYTTSFYSSVAVVNGTDSIHNIPGPSQYRQALLKFRTSSCSATASTIDISACHFYLSPSGKTWISSGVHYDTLVNIGGCDSILTVSLTLTKPDTMVTIDGLTLSSGADQALYQWLDCNNSYQIISGEDQQSFVATNNGSYAVEVNQNGCVDTSNCISITTAQVAELQSSAPLLVYPNPGKGIYYLDVQNTHNLSLQVVDAQGKVIAVYEDLIENHFEINAPAGIYTVILEQGSTKQFIRLVHE